MSPPHPTALLSSTHCGGVQVETLTSQSAAEQRGVSDRLDEQQELFTVSRAGALN